MKKEGVGGALYCQLTNQQKNTEIAYNWKASSHPLDFKYLPESLNSKTHIFNLSLHFVIPPPNHQSLIRDLSLPRRVYMGWWLKYCGLWTIMTIIVSLVQAEDPYRFFDWRVTYGNIYPLGIPQRVLDFLPQYQCGFFFFF